jgi:formiminoglutamase
MMSPDREINSLPNSLPHFLPTKDELFFTRNDVNDPRLGDLAKKIPDISSAELLQETMTEADSALPGRNFGLAGYPDDEGIRINGGRLGASLAPTEIRRSLYKMTPSVLATRPTGVIWDLGDLNLNHPAHTNLENRHTSVIQYAASALHAGAAWIGLGGGHDYGFADAAAYCEWAKSKGIRPLVINFDAHLDVRPTNKGLSSGTPFFRMLENYPDVDFAEIGIQPQCTSRAHLDWAKSRGARVLTTDELELNDESLLSGTTRLLGDWLLRPRPIYLSIDIDGFSSSVAPGCSQSWSTGFMPSDFFATFNLLQKRLDIRVLGIYEVSPPLDHDSRTAKLAAQIIHRVVS